MYGERIGEEWKKGKKREDEEKGGKWKQVGLEEEDKERGEWEEAEEEQQQKENLTDMGTSNDNESIQTYIYEFMVQKYNIQHHAQTVKLVLVHFNPFHTHRLLNYHSF